MTSTFNPSWSYTKWSTNPAPHLQRRKVELVHRCRTHLGGRASHTVYWLMQGHKSPKMASTGNWLQEKPLFPSCVSFIWIQPTERAFWTIASKLPTKSLPVVLSSGLFFRAHVIHIRQHNRCWMSAVKHWKKRLPAGTLRLQKSCQCTDYQSCILYIYIYLYIYIIHMWCDIMDHLNRSSKS